MLKSKLLISSALLLSILLFCPVSSAFGQSAKKRYIDRKSIKFNIGELALADIPIASRLGISYEFLLDRNYGIMIGMSYLTYPTSMWGKDSLSRAWRANVDQKGYNFDLSFRHYFDNADESSYYISTFFSTSRLWIESVNIPSIIMKKDRVALVFGYQKRWQSLYMDFSCGLGVKIKNWKSYLRQIPTTNNRLSPDYNWGMGWNFEFNRPTTTIAMPVQFLMGFRF